MEKLIEDYLRFLTGMVQSDAQQLDHLWMWLPFMVPAILWIVYVLMKVCLLTSPFWLPPRMVLSSARGLLWNSVRKYGKKKKKKAVKGEATE